MNSGGLITWNNSAYRMLAICRPILNGAEMTKGIFERKEGGSER